MGDSPGWLRQVGEQAGGGMLHAGVRAHAGQCQLAFARGGRVLGSLAVAPPVRAS
jgi:hypothetical protein